MGSLKFLVVIVFALTVFSSLPRSTEAEMNVVQVINASFPVLYRYVSLYPELVAALSDPSSTFTVFAPIDSAFNGTTLQVNTSLPILSYHVASGLYRPSNLTFGNYIPTLLVPFPMANNSQVLIVGSSNSSATLNGVVVQNQPQNATNGVVYAIEGLLMPPTNYVEDIVMSSYKTLNSLVSLSGLSLKIHPLTLFAPTDAAFTSLPSVITNYLMLNNTLSRPDLTNILLHHAVGVPVYTGQLDRGATKEIPTLYAGTDISLSKPIDYPNSSVIVYPNARVNQAGADIVQPNILAANGVVHGINSVLVPSNFSFTLEKVISGLGATSYLQQVKNMQLESYLLDDSSARTLFVPTNAAIGNMNLTRNGLLYHAIPNSFNESQLESGYLLGSLLSLSSLDNGTQFLKFAVQVNTTTLLVNGVPLRSGIATIQTPVMSYVYLIDQVLAAPADLPSVLASNSDYSTLVQAVGAVHLSQLYNNSLTVFAPTNEAFDMLAPGVVGYLLNTNISSPDLLTSILLNHVVDNGNIYYSNRIPLGSTTVTTLSRNTITINKSNSNVTVNGAAVVYPDMLAANGVAHGINRVLIPAGVTFSLQNVLEGLGNYTKLLSYLSDTGLLNLLNNTNLTIFAPDDDAFENVDDLDALTSDTVRLTEVLKAHVVLMNISMLSTNETFPTQVPGQQIVVTMTNPDVVELRNSSTGEVIGTSADVGVVTYGRNGYAYSINRVLGVQQASSSSGGLKLWQKVLIVVGSVVGGLLLLVLVAAIGYFIYHVYFKNKNGYRKIND